MLVTLKLTKHYGNNVSGEIASFTPKTAEHILKHAGGEELARFDESTHRFDVKSSKAVPLFEDKSAKKS
ncbi:MAG: hypothetical protein AMXMBFR56_72430 [Polyangiaceae bacterium]